MGQTAARGGQLAGCSKKRQSTLIISDARIVEAGETSLPFQDFKVIQEEESHGPNTDQEVTKSS